MKRRNLKASKIEPRVMAHPLNSPLIKKLMVEGNDNGMDDIRTKGQLIGTKLRMFVHDDRP